MRIVLMSDTHIPRRARDLPAPLWTEVEAADVVVHAGDSGRGHSAPGVTPARCRNRPASPLARNARRPTAVRT